MNIRIISDKFFVTIPCKSYIFSVIKLNHFVLTRQNMHVNYQMFVNP